MHCSLCSSNPKNEDGDKVGCIFKMRKMFSLHGISMAPLDLRQDQSIFHTKQELSSYVVLLIRVLFIVIELVCHTKLSLGLFTFHNEKSSIVHRGMSKQMAKTIFFCIKHFIWMQRVLTLSCRLDGMARLLCVGTPIFLFSL